MLAVCEEPFGAHPQPLHFAPSAPALRTYRDDYAQYELWRALGEGQQSLDAFSRTVLEAADGKDGYRQFVGAERLERLVTRPGRSRPKPSALAVVPTVTHELDATERLLLLAARMIVRRVRSQQLVSILAGLGQSFTAVRLAKLLLAGVEDCDPEVMIETGFAGIDLEHADGFLLSEQNVASAGRLASIDVMLGVLTCGNHNRCLGVIGAAQVDRLGNVNSTFVGGDFLVGSGGASDIAASAEDVIVLTQCDRKRLVENVEYITSPGRRVRTVVTSECVLERGVGETTWRVADVLPSASGVPLTAESLSERCPWPLVWPVSVTLAEPPNDTEQRFFNQLRSVRANPERSTMEASRA